jgi:hypothetical protein
MDAQKKLLSLGARQDDFRHEALFYGDEGEFMASQQVLAIRP